MIVCRGQTPVCVIMLPKLHPLYRSQLVGTAVGALEGEHVPRELCSLDFFPIRAVMLRFREGKFSDLQILQMENIDNGAAHQKHHQGNDGGDQ